MEFYEDFERKNKMEYKKLNEEEVLNLKVGTFLNFGNGDVEEFLGFEDGPICKVYKDGKVVDQKEYYALMKKSNGEMHKFYLRVLQGATIESLDTSIGKCAYCGLLRPESEMVSETIWINHGQRTGRYCKDKPCGGYAQMSAEG